MFGWLFAWWHNRQRQIFRYWDGKTYRRADPLEILRSFALHPTCNLDRDLQLAHAGDLAADNEVYRAICDVFKIPPFDLGGLTRTECYELLTSFHEWLDSVKKNTATQPTLPDSTAVPLLDPSTTKPVSG